MQIILNGESYEMEAGTSIASLLARLELGGDKVAVERNLEIVPRAQFTTQALAAGDRVEIVHFIGGG